MERVAPLPDCHLATGPLLAAEPLLAPDDLMVGRREDPRHRLDLSARFVTPGANTRVQLEDISASGACIRLKEPRPLEDGRLCWLNFVAFARMVWKGDARCGLRFEEPLSADCLARTIEFGELMAGDGGDRFLRLASAWTHGPGDW